MSMAKIPDWRLFIIGLRNGVQLVKTLRLMCTEVMIAVS